jgi:hypothetical protein
MIALGPKCYTTWNNTNDKKTLKIKGVSLKQNSHITHQSFQEVVNGGMITGKNHTLQVKKIGDEHQTVRMCMEKTALSGRHTKMYCYPDGICAPLIKGCKYV